VGASKTSIREAVYTFLPRRLLSLLLRGIVAFVSGRLRGHPDFDLFVCELSNVQATRGGMHLAQMLSQVITLLRICCQVCLREPFRSRKCIHAASQGAPLADF
jgi:hypothetical protein